MESGVEDIEVILENIAIVDKGLHRYGYVLASFYLFFDFKETVIETHCNVEGITSILWLKSHFQCCRRKNREHDENVGLSVCLWISL